MSELTAFERFKEKVIGKVDAARGQCWFVHQWGRWSRKHEGTLTYTDTGATAGFWFLQERECGRCGKTEREYREQV